MNILFLTDNFPPEVNASASRVYERACYWVKWGHSVTVITSAPNFPEGKIYPGYKNKWYQIEDMQGIRVIRVKTFMAKNTGMLLRILDFISYMLMAVIVGLWQKNPDVIVATSPQFFAAVGGWLLSVLKNKPFVFELSDLWPASIVAVGAMHNKRLLAWVEKLELFLYKHAAVVVALTTAFKENLIERGISADKIVVVINGVDLQRYSPTEKNAALLAACKMRDCFVVGYLGTHGMAHALHNVLAAAKILSSHADIRFLFVGDGAEREQLMQSTEQQQLDNALFVPKQSKEKIADYWSICDAALVHLKDDPVFAAVIPSKIFEAMGMGLPILIAAPPGEGSKVVLAEQAGMWVPAEQPSALADAVLQMKTNPTRLKQWATNSQQAAQRYSRERQANDMLAVLTRIADL